MLSPAARATDLLEEWNKQSGSCELSEMKERHRKQLEAEFQHVMRVAYARGYNDCLRENVAVTRNSS